MRYSTTESGTTPYRTKVKTAPSTEPCGDNASAMDAMPTT
jgi:hypothetical protein